MGVDTSGTQLGSKTFLVVITGGGGVEEFMLPGIY